jgi:hypothetical protein
VDDGENAVTADGAGRREQGHAGGARQLFSQFAVGVHNIQKGFDAGFQTGIGGMAVQLQSQGGFAAHHVTEIADQKRIRTAGEIGDVGAEEL